MIKNIILDYGNVIFDIEHQRTIQAFIDLGIQHDKGFFGQLAQDPLFDQFEKGKINDDAFIRGIQNFSDVPLTEEQIRHAWNALLIGIRPGYLEHLLALKTQYRTFLLSNNNSIHYAWIMDYLAAQYGVASMESFFEKDYYSHLMGMRKPDADIFEFVLNKHELNPAETLFIDDSPQHIATAKSLGLQTHWMLAEHDLRQILPL
jgi:putative hydrolase of the HAD superfamily